MGLMMEHLNEKILDKVKERLWIVSSSLTGLGGLFTQGSSDSCFDSEEISGIGRFLKKLSEELIILEDILNCGYDSGADMRNGVDQEENDEELEEIEEKSENSQKTDL